MHAIRISSLIFGTASLLALGCASATDPAPAEEAILDAPLLTDSLGTALSPVLREMVLANRMTELELNLVLRIQTRPGSLFEVYEPSPGALIYSGGGSRETSAPIPATTEAEQHAAAIDAALASATSNDGAAATSAGTGSIFSGSLVEVLARVAPRSLELPEVQAAVERQRERFELNGLKPPGPSLAEARQLVRDILGQGEVLAPQEPRVQQADGAPLYLRGTSFSGGFCDEEYFDSSWPGYRFRTPGACPSKLGDQTFDSKHCIDDWEGYPYDRKVNNARYGHTNVCAASGTVVLAVKWEEDASSWSVPQDNWRWYENSDSWCILPGNDCPYFRSAVQDLQLGDRSHSRFFSYD